MAVVMDISDRVSVLDFGRLIADGTPDEVKTNPQVVEAYPAPRSTDGRLRQRRWLDRHRRRAGHQYLPQAAGRAGGLPPQRHGDAGEAVRHLDAADLGAVCRTVRDFAHGLASMGIERGISSRSSATTARSGSSPFAAQSIGAAVVGIYPTSIGEELLHILTLARIRVVVAEDQEQVDKLLKLRADQAAAPSTDMPPLLVETVVFYDPHGLEQYVDPVLEGLHRGRGRRPRVGCPAPRLVCDAQVALGQPGTPRWSVRPRGRRAAPCSPS